MTTTTQRKNRSASPAPQPTTKGKSKEAHEVAEKRGGMVSDFLTVHVNVWRLFGCSFMGDFQTQNKIIDQSRPLFKDLDAGVSMVLNSFSLNLMHVLLVKLAFSAEMLSFVLLWVVLPSLVGSCSYIYFKFGQRAFSIDIFKVLAWLRNWMLMNAVALVCWTQHFVLYFGLLLVEPVLPARLQGTYTFPIYIMEEYIKSCVYVFYILSAVLFLSVPVHRYAYCFNMKLIGRKSDMSTSEALMEIVHHTATSMAAYQTMLPTIVLHAKVAPFHVIHIIFSVVESALLNISTKYKFCILHGFTHKIKPLYNTVHIEHHVCKGVYPNTSAAGMWEFWMYAQGFGFFTAPLASLPYLHFHMIYCGANILVHTMWPIESMAQWHTLHHVVNADVYSVNIPNDYDEKFSSDFSKFNDALAKASPFVRVWWLSDAVAGLFATLAILFFHYVVGVGFFHVMHLAQ